MSSSKKSTIKIVTAAYLMVGDEILSGRTKDKNLNFIAKELSNMGISLKEVRIVPDDKFQIIKAVNDLRKKYNYLFTTGGIGPTHDDITIDAICDAIGDKMVKNLEAERILIDYYGKNINKSSLKMAILPSKASLLNNPTSSVPGFMLENIIAMAGVPKNMQKMFKAAKKNLICGSKIFSKEIITKLIESSIAKELENLQNEFEDLSIGIYPFNEGTSIVLKSFDKNILDESFQKIKKIIQ